MPIDNAYSDRASILLKVIKQSEKSDFNPCANQLICFWFLIKYSIMTSYFTKTNSYLANLKVPYLNIS